MAKESSFINIFGTYVLTKAEALKDWTGNGCDVKGVSVTSEHDALANSRLPDVYKYGRRHIIELNISPVKRPRV